MVARGIHNNNPGNIRKGGSVPWKGLAAEQTDSAFLQFKSPFWGLRALARILVNYQQAHGLNTVRKIINRWAPPNENNTDAYVAAVSAAVGVEPDDSLGTQNLGFLVALVEAIVQHENGEQPYPFTLILSAAWDSLHQS